MLASTRHLYSIYAGGALCLAWAGFHLLFPRLFKWTETLKKLDSVNRAIYQVMNLCLVFLFAALGYLSLVFAPELLSTPLGSKLAGIVGAFWLLRFGLQQKFFKPWHPASLGLSVMFLITAGCYLFPVLQGVR